jgi:hypothetical protein
MPENETQSQQTFPKTGLLPIAGIFAAVLAIPVGMAVVWFPRELDRLYDEIVTAATQSSAAKDAAERAAAESLAVGNKITGLVAAMAKSDAVRNGSSGWFAVKELLPVDLVDAVENAGIVASFRHARFNDAEWVFVDPASFNQLTSSNQSAIKNSIEQNNAHFNLADFEDLQSYRTTYDGMNINIGRVLQSPPDGTMSPLEWFQVE